MAGSLNVSSSSLIDIQTCEAPGEFMSCCCLLDRSVYSDTKEQVSKQICSTLGPHFVGLGALGIEYPIF